MELMTINEVCKLLKVTRWTVSKLIESGELKASKIGNTYRIKKTDVEDMLNASQVK